MRDAVRSGLAQAPGRLPSNYVLQLDLVLQLSDQAGLDSFLKALHDPTSPSYRQFFDTQQFTARFGPSQSDYDTLVRIARTYGFQIVGDTRDSMDVQVKVRWPTLKRPSMDSHLPGLPSVSRVLWPG